MADQPAGERTEEATPRRRQQARRKGTVARSSDLIGALVVCALMIVLPYSLSMIGTGFVTGFNTLMAGSLTDASPAALSQGFLTVLEPCALGISVLIGTAMVVGVVANFAQVGFVLSGEALSPNLNKLNPMSGFKRLFSLRSSFEGIKAVAKSAIFGLIAYGALTSSFSKILGMSLIEPKHGLALVGEIMRTVCIRIAIVWLAMAAIDYFFQFKQTNKQLMMSKDEVKQEMKEMEQSAELKMAVAQRRRKLQRRMMQAVKTADAVITNPTHYAVAVKYEPGKLHAPQVVAKGTDFLAAKIREEAAAHGVPIVPNPPLARALYRVCEVGDFVPREHFQAVAEVLAYVYKTLKKIRR